MGRKEGRKGGRERTILNKQHDLLGKEHEGETEEDVLLGDARKGAGQDAADVMLGAEGVGVGRGPDVGF
jgi:hypothetical protein